MLGHVTVIVQSTVEPLYSGLGEQNVGRYIEVAFIEGLFCTHIDH